MGDVEVTGRAMVGEQSVHIRWVWSPSDPLAVALVLRRTAPVRWTMSRELLRRAAGSRETVGVGDVRVALHPEMRGLLVVGLSSPGGSCDVVLLRGVVLRFLAATYRAVPAHAEEAVVDVAVDRMLAELGV